MNEKNIIDPVELHDEKIKIDDIVENIIDPIDDVVEILNNYYDVELIDNYIYLYDINEFEINEIENELFNNLIEFKIVEKNINELIVVVDPITEKNNIECYDEFINYINELKLIDKYDINNIKFNIDDDVEFDDVLLLDNFKKVFENTLNNNNIELYDNIDELIDDYYYYDVFNKFEFEIDNNKLILLDIKHKIIKNLNSYELYDIVNNYISTSLDLYNKVYYDKIIDVFNIIKKYNEKIYVDDPVNKIYYDIFDDDIDVFNKYIKDHKKQIDNYDDKIEFFYVSNITSSKKIFINIIEFENINDIFDDDVIDDLINYLSSIYYYFYDELNDLKNILDIEI